MSGYDPYPRRKFSVICIATTSPRAVATPSAYTVASTVTFRPLVSFTRPRTSHSPLWKPPDFLSRNVDRGSRSLPIHRWFGIPKGYNTRPGIPFPLDNNEHMLIIHVEVSLCPDHNVAVELPGDR